jgi:hypothetical protein
MPVINAIPPRLPQPGHKWRLDEIVITIGGKKHWLWRAVDQDGIVLDVLVHSCVTRSLCCSRNECVERKTSENPVCGENE